MRAAAHNSAQSGMTEFQSCCERVGHPHDFVVDYSFFTPNEGGRKSGAPYQGYRSDFWYQHENHEINGVFMTWPEFLDRDGQLITETVIAVPEHGTARMYILDDKMRRYHQEKITVGLTGYFMEGSQKVTVCTVREREIAFSPIQPKLLKSRNDDCRSRR